MLATYESRTQALLQNPNAPTTLYPLASIDSWINQARGQVAGEGECIRRQGTLALAQGTSVYPFSSISISDSAVQGVINVRQMLIGLGTGNVWVTPRGFEWLTLYRLNNPVPQQARPTDWSQYGQGAAPAPSQQADGGSLYVDPVPDQPYTLTLDCVCYPITLVDNTTPEAIPYLWTDAVPYFAAYLALLSAQTGAREEQANRMFNRYQTFVNRARAFSNPSVLGGQYAQAPSLVRENQLGLQSKAAAQ